MSRPRTVAISVALAVLLATAGCVGFLTGSQPLQFAANATEVDDATLEETGYQLSNSASPNRTMNITAAGQDRQVEVSNELRQYNRTVSLAPGIEGSFARFSVYTTPTVSVAGRTLNPVGDWSDGRLVRELVVSSGGLSDVQFQSNRSVRALGEQRTVSTFRGRQSLGGAQTNVTIHLASIEHEEDHVIAVAVHPERLDEESTVDALLQGLRHRGS